MGMAAAWISVHGVLRKKVPEFIYPEIEQGYQQQRFFVRQGMSCEYNGLQSLLNISIGVIDGYSYGQLASYIRKHKETHRVEAISGSMPPGRIS